MSHHGHTHHDHTMGWTGHEPRGKHGGGGRGGHGDMGGGWGGGRRRMRRGDIRKAILGALTDGPAHGYEVMRRLEERSGGIWRPSPGSVYPTLQMLEDEGLVKAQAHDGTRTYELTDRGRTDAEAGASAGDDAPWDRGDADADRVRLLRTAVGQVMVAARQVAAAGKSEQIDRSVEVIQRARKELYQILAED